MRKHAQGMNTRASVRTRRFQFIGVLIVVIVVAIAATAISMKASKGETPRTEVNSAGAKSNTRGHALPLRSVQDGQSFSQSQIRPLTQEEAQQMAEGLKELVSQSTEGLQQVRHADGSVSMDLQGRFQSAALAKRDEDGKLILSCVDNPQAAAAFFGIDPQLVGGKGNTSSLKTTSEKGRNQ